MRNSPWTYWRNRLCTTPTPAAKPTAVSTVPRVRCGVSTSISSVRPSPLVSSQTIRAVSRKGPVMSMNSTMTARMKRTRADMVHCSSMLRTLSTSSRVEKGLVMYASAPSASPLATSVSRPLAVSIRTRTAASAGSALTS